MFHVEGLFSHTLVYAVTFDERECVNQETNNLTMSVANFFLRNKNKNTFSLVASHILTGRNQYHAITETTNLYSENNIFTDYLLSFI